MEPTHKPRLAVTVGDITGIGPEIIVKGCMRPELQTLCRLVAIGPPEVLRKAAAIVDLPLEVTEIGLKELNDETWNRPRNKSRPSILCLPTESSSSLAPNQETQASLAGQIAYEALVLATDLALEGTIDGVVTAPLSKAALHAAGHFYPGHTEILAQRCGIADFAMMLYLPPGPLHAAPHGLGVAHVTLHMPLRNALDALTLPRIVQGIELANRGLRDFGVPEPRVAVCALNPHGGEGGLFGDEEQRIIAPAIQEAQDRGINASGPWPADTLFSAARTGQYDAVVAMYHDQGHIAVKSLGMHAAVNVTLGLPIVRTSVAHGTAFNIAGSGAASEESLLAAIHAAVALCRNRQRRSTSFNHATDDEVSIQGTSGGGE